MGTFTTSGLSIPNQILDPWLGKVKYGSTIATLSGATPMKFGPVGSGTAGTPRGRISRCR